MAKIRAGLSSGGGEVTAVSGSLNFNVQSEYEIDCPFEPSVVLMLGELDGKTYYADSLWRKDVQPTKQFQAYHNQNGGAVYGTPSYSNLGSDSARGSIKSISGKKVTFIRTVSSGDQYSAEFTYCIY